MSEIILNVEGVDLIDLYGEKNSKLKLLQSAFPEVTFTSRGDAIKLTGEKKFTQKAKAKIELMIRLIKAEHELTIQVIEDLLNGENPFDTKPANGLGGQVIVYGRNGQAIRAKTKNQKVLVDTVETNDIVFAVGPAGTGKTYTAVALAVRALKNKLVKKIILTRPAVEAGESLGFLPGDLKEKVDPYLRPLYDALDDLFPHDKLAHLMTTRVIEVAPLAFMRGRTLDHAFIILDEAQNATSMQLKMFLTRLGPSAQCVITGDLTQIDLPFHQKSGLQQSIDLLSDLDGVGTVYLQTEDVVRHRLVKEIIRAYERSDLFARESRERRQREKEGFGQLPASEQSEDQSS